MGALFFLSAIPGTERAGDSSFVWIVAMTPRLWQKLLHVVFYGALTCLWIWSLAGLAGPRTRWAAATLIAVVFGAAMEWYQLGVPGRFATSGDVLLNAVGAVCGLLAAVTFRALIGRPVGSGS